jgi:hypothetical protein
MNESMQHPQIACTRKRCITAVQRLRDGIKTGHMPAAITVRESLQAIRYNQERLYVLRMLEAYDVCGEHSTYIINLIPKEQST